MRILRNPPRLLMAALLLGIAQPALAEVFCVATAVGFQNALVLAAYNGQDDEVRIVQGTYVGNFVYASTEAQALSVLGGYTAGCADRTLDPVNTILDGNQTGTVLRLSASAVAAEFVVEGLTLRKGSCSSGGGGGLNAMVGPGGEVMVANNFISGNTAYSAGGGVYLSATTATLTNNDISGNTSYPSYSAGGGVFLQATSVTSVTLTNNDISGNIAYHGGGLYAAFSEPQSSVALFNNLFWLNHATANRGADFYISNKTASQVTLLANNFDWTTNTGFLVGMPVYIDASNLDKLDPLFVDASTGDFHLQPGSPMIDAGYPATPDLPDFDIEGTPRVLGNSVDIGAYEFDDGSDPKAILSLTLAGTGSGTVTSSPTGINCGSDCFQAYDIDTLVTLTATPTDANSVFAGWSGDEDCADGQVTMATHLGCTATFSAVRQLTVTRSGDGSGLITSTPTGIDCGAACAAYFYQDELVTLTAMPDAISTFAGWSGDASCPNLKLDVNRSCTATFNPKLFRLYTFVVGTGGGQVTSNPAGIDCGTDCEEDYVANTLVTLTATPDARSNFAGWTGPCTGTAPTCQVTLSEVRGVAAIFNLKIYTLSVSKLGKGVVTSNPAGIVCGTYCRDKFEAGTRVTLTASPVVGSGFVNWGGACTGTGRVCTLTLDAAKNVTATFVPLTVAISDVTQIEGNSGTSTFNFTVSLNASTHRTVTVNYATLNGTAKAGSDYTARTGLVTFTADQITKSVRIVVRGDTIKENNETFFVNLATPVGATFAKQQGRGTITNDD